MSKPKRIFRPSGEVQLKPDYPKTFWIQRVDKSDQPTQVTGWDKGTSFDVWRTDDTAKLRIIHPQGPNGWEIVNV